MSRFAKPAVGHQKFATDKKAYGFECKMIIEVYHPKSFWFIKK